MLYHCCGTNPKPHVCNKESLIRDTTRVRARIKNHFQKPYFPFIALEANDEVNGCTSRKDPIWICASCNEIVYHQSRDEMAKTVSIENIKSEFKVPQSDIDETSAKHEVETIATHFQVLRVSNNECIF